ncbi:MAG: phosphatidate cytidylyltransferase [Phycisphaerales bacterium]|jgi:phosphatidate cytidylyltransferase|nr:phosphatidate cytidylyltransferase [Phycisphaerales bacterium]MDB5354784.1 phosphatidate cytidylyltransferase [Phycisphaerales bacterium]
MTPHAALHSTIFWTYAAITGGLLAVAGLSIAFVRYRLRKDVRSVWLTYRSWLVMVPMIAVVVFLGRWAVIAGAVLLACFAFKEFARATGVWRDRWMTGGVYLALVAVGIVCLVKDPHDHVPGWRELFMAMPAYAIILLFTIPILRNRIQGQLQLVALCVLGFLLGWMFLHITLLANSRNPYGYLLYVLFATEVNDVAAFGFGRLLGKHPLRTNISPRKTWEGALGAAAFSVLLAFALSFSFQGRFKLGQLLLIGLIIGVGGQLGDLAISVIKRDTGIKDLGASIPGHGGILDRIDSLIFVAPLMAAVIGRQ